MKLNVVFAFFLGWTISTVLQPMMFPSRYMEKENVQEESQELKDTKKVGHGGIAREKCSIGGPLNCLKPSKTPGCQLEPRAPLISKPEVKEIWANTPKEEGRITYMTHYDLLDKSAIYTHGPIKILGLGTDVYGQSFRKTMAALNDGGWTVLHTESGTEQIWNNDGYNCSNFDAMTIDKLFRIDWDVIYVGPNLSEAGKTAVVAWWARAKTSTERRRAQLIIMKHEENALAISDEPLVKSAETLVYNHDKAYTFEERLKVPLLTPSLAIRHAPSVGFATDRTAKSGDVRYSVEFDVVVEDSYQSRRHEPTYSDVKDWLWGTADPYDLSAFPGILKEVARGEAEIGHRALSGSGYPGLIPLLKPKMIVELGVFRGGSTLEAVKQLKRAGLNDSFVVSVDTWMNDFCLTMPKVKHDKTDDKYLFSDYCKFPNANGASLMYYGTLTAIKNAGNKDWVLPLPASTMVATHIFMEAGWTPDLIFVDASHAFADVLFDMENWWTVLKCGGVMFGDDFGVAGVMQAVNLFAFKRGININQYAYDRFWILPPKQC